MCEKSEFMRSLVLFNYFEKVNQERINDEFHCPVNKSLFFDDGYNTLFTSAPLITAFGFSLLIFTIFVLPWDPRKLRAFRL
jgi:hypothetical protein